MYRGPGIMVDVYILYFFESSLYPMSFVSFGPFYRRGEPKR